MSAEASVVAGGPSNFAIVRTGGKQYKVSPGQKIFVEKLEGDVGAGVELTEVLLLAKTGASLQIGTPLIEGSKVSAKIVDQIKEKKVVTYKKRKRKGYTKKQGHRQQKTQLLIEVVE